MQFPAAAVVGMGNRCWGWKYHYLGAALMGLGNWDAQHYPLWALPVFMGLAFLWRAPSSGPWLNLQTGNDWKSAFMRNLLMVPTIAFKFYFTHDLTTIAIGICAILAHPAAYWIAGHKQSKYDATAVGELFGGIFYGLG